MTDHFHDIGDLIRSDNTPPLGFRANLCWKVILVGFEDGGLMETNRCCLQVHIEEDGVGILYSSRQS